MGCAGSLKSAAAGNSVYSPHLDELNQHPTEPLERGKVANHSPVIIAGVPCSHQRGHTALDELLMLLMAFFPR